MFGLGFGEILVIAIIVLIAVGPDRMPALFKTVGRGLREVRRAGREFRDTVGIDRLLEDEDLRELRRPVRFDTETPKLSVARLRDAASQGAASEPESPAPLAVAGASPATSGPEAPVSGGGSAPTAPAAGPSRSPAALAARAAAVRALGGTLDEARAGAEPRVPTAPPVPAPPPAKEPET